MSNLKDTKRIHIDTKEFVHRLLDLEDSTTFFLESLEHKKLMVKSVSQCLTCSSQTRLLLRTSLLFFESDDEPSLYCKCELDYNSLTSQEYQLLSKKNIPIGRLFSVLNKDVEISKKNIVISREVDPEAAHILKVSSPELYKKKYDYWVGARLIGNITEIFNEQSIVRVYK